MNVFHLTNLCLNGSHKIFSFLVLLQTIGSHRFFLQWDVILHKARFSPKVTSDSIRTIRFKFMQLPNFIAVLYEYDQNVIH